MTEIVWVNGIHLRESLEFPEKFIELLLLFQLLWLVHFRG